MKYIGNYKDWIDPKWLDTILSTYGKPVPKEWEAQNLEEFEEVVAARNAGYKMNAIYCWFYFPPDVTIDSNPPWCKNQVRMCWFVKMDPGQFVPIHRDRFRLPTTRYWVALQDYEAGHILVHGDDGAMIKDYKLGDVYQLDTANELYGESNISLTPLVALHIAEELE
jgi:hypothetical protein